MKIKLLIATLMALSTASCNGAVPAPPSAEPVTLAAYAVPEGFGEPLVRIINGAFGKMSGGESDRTATASLLPDGKVLLIGPAAVHRDFKKTVSSLDPAAIPKQTNVSLTVWMIAAGPQFPRDSAALPDDLKEPVGQLGLPADHGVKVLESLTLVTMPNAAASARGTMFDFSPRIIDNHGTLTANVELLGRDPLDTSMETRIHLEPGRFLVIGESTLPLDEHFLRQIKKGQVEDADLRALAEAPAMLFYVFHAGR